MDGTPSTIYNDANRGMPFPVEVFSRGTEHRWGDLVCRRNVRSCVLSCP